MFLVRKGAYNRSADEILAVKNHAFCECTLIDLRKNAENVLEMQASPWDTFIQYFM